MAPDVLILIATGCLAVVAMIAAVVSLRNLKEIRKSIAESPSSASHGAEASDLNTSDLNVAAHAEQEPVQSRSEPELLTPVIDGDLASSAAILSAIPAETTHQELVPHHGQIARVVDGQVVVTPTRGQVATAIMGQPRVRFAIWATGIAHALRPESRDRIVGLMRRDFRERRRYREQAARAAIRAAHSPATRADEGTTQ
mgnify:CR=1 FL=1